MNETRLPNLIIIGAQKCATTSLHYYLNLHPEISMSRVKESNFFIKEFNWNRGIEWYRAQFDVFSRVRGESSPGYTTYPLYDGVPARMYSVVPNAKVIYILRDPIERTISHYVHNYAEGRETRGMEEALGEYDGRNQYVVRSMYSTQLEQYLQFFPWPQIHIMTADDLQKGTKAAMEAVFRFLGVDDSYWSPQFYLKWHRTRFKWRTPDKNHPVCGPAVKAMLESLPFELRGLMTKLLLLPFSKRVKRPVLTSRLRKRLLEYLREDMQRLRALTGKRFAGWSL